MHASLLLLNPSQLPHPCSTSVCRPAPPCSVPILASASAQSIPNPPVPRARAAVGDKHDSPQASGARASTRSEACAI
ncbi:hypothetical protein BU26DRAFT_517048, partial [Trematosphaeria pertusa]